MAYQVVYSRHARQRMALGGISRVEVEEATLVGSKTRQEGKIIASYRYFSVVYLVRGERCFVITVKPRW